MYTTGTLISRSFHFLWILLLDYLPLQIFFLVTTRFATWIPIRMKNHMPAFHISCKNKKAHLAWNQIAMKYSVITFTIPNDCISCKGNFLDSSTVKMFIFAKIINSISHSREPWLHARGLTRFGHKLKESHFWHFKMHIVRSWNLLIASDNRLQDFRPSSWIVMLHAAHIGFPLGC